LLRPLENWSANSIGSLAMGQEVSVTPIQIISAISAIANGGTLYRPHIVRKFAATCAGRGTRARNRSRRPTQKTAATVREMMEDVVLKAREAGAAERIHGGGKIRNGAEDRSRHRTLFGDSVQFVVRRLRAGERSGGHDSGGARFARGAHHGGEVGGPVFKRIAEQVLAYLDVAHDVPGRRPESAIGNAASRKARRDGNGIVRSDRGN
jgi:cell division protein FtsI (penicillin-binding protein 3)